MPPRPIAHLSLLQPSPPTPSCHSRSSPWWAPTLPFPSPTPLQIPLQHLPTPILCRLPPYAPPCTSPSPPVSLTPPPFPYVSPFRPRAKEREGDPPGASREWLGGRGWPVLSVSYPLSRSWSPNPGLGGTEDGAWGRASAAGGREGEAALSAPPSHAQHTLPRPLPRTPPRCSAHVSPKEEAGEMGRKAGTHPPARRALPGCTRPQEMAHRNWLQQGRAPCWKYCVQASGLSGLLCALASSPLSPSLHRCITPSLHPSLLWAPEDPASSSLIEATYQAVFPLRSTPTPLHISLPHTP